MAKYIVPGQQRQQPSHCLVVCSFVQLWKTAQFQNDCLHACSFPPQRAFLERRQWICHAFEDGTYDRHEGPESNAASYENRPALSIPQPRLENSHHEPWRDTCRQLAAAYALPKERMVVTASSTSDVNQVMSCLRPCLQRPANIVCHPRMLDGACCTFCKHTHTVTCRMTTRRFTAFERSN